MIIKVLVNRPVERICAGLYDVEDSNSTAAIDSDISASSRLLPCDFRSPPDSATSGQDAGGDEGGPELTPLGGGTGNKSRA